MKYNPHELQEAVEAVLDGDGIRSGISAGTVYDALADNKQFVRDLLRLVLSAEEKEAFELANEVVTDKCQAMLVSAAEGEL